MLRTTLLLAWVLVLSGPAARALAEPSPWQPVPGRLRTRWAADVKVEQPWPEYPRPQLVRPVWVNLNGLWDYAIVPREAARPAAWDGRILVPYPVESALSGVQRPLTAEQRLWYRRGFAAPELTADQRLLLHFGAVDWETQVRVNGQEVGTHRGGYDPFTLDITRAVRAGGDNELVVTVFDGTGGYQPKGKQNFGSMARPGGILYTPCSGIWQTVWLEVVPATYIRELKVSPDVDRKQVRVTAVTAGQAQDARMEVRVLEAGKVIATAEGQAGAPVALAIGQPRLWSPETPFLYDLEIRCTAADGTRDAVASYFGMRKVATARDEAGRVRILLNDQPIFQIGLLDQGYWPDGIYTAPTDEALRYDIEITRQLGMNLARKHVKVEPARWYYWCDRLGLLVWQDMPSAAAGREAGRDAQTGQLRDGTPVSPEAAAQFEAELQAIVRQLQNHPSIVMWIVFNEGWGQYDTRRITEWVQQLDATRLVSNASGWHDIPAGHVIDLHAYPGPACPPGDGVRAPVLGEFGGLGLPMPGHTWVDQSWGYRNLSDVEELTWRYIELIRDVYQLKETQGLNAAVYTQTTDVETECNGLLTYDRQLKVDPATIAAANRGAFPPPPRIETVVPTSEEKGLLWRYVLAPPADDWLQPGYDDAGWSEGPGGFGAPGTPGAVVGTTWKGREIWLRRQITLPDPLPSGLALRLHHDEDAEVYVNGVLAARKGGFTTRYELTSILPEARKALQGGANLVAVHCRQTQGGQYIDVGLVRLVEQPRPGTSGP